MVEVLEHEFGTKAATKAVVHVFESSFFNALSGPHRKVYKRYWDKLAMPKQQDKADKVAEKDKRVTSDALLNLFRRSGLTFDTLELIWDCACQHEASKLNQPEFMLAMRMVAAAQSGIQGFIKKDHLYNKNIKPPKFNKPPLEDKRLVGDAQGAEYSNVTEVSGEPELVPAEPRISSRRSTLDKPSRTHTKKKQHSGKHKKTRGHSVNTDDREGLADAETASISSQPGASATSDVTAEDAGDRWKLSEAQLDSYLVKFPQANLEEGKTVGKAAAAQCFRQSGLAQKDLRQVWALVDPLDGKFRKNEFLVAVHMLTVKRNAIKRDENVKIPIPKVLPKCLADFIDAGN